MTGGLSSLKKAPSKLWLALMARGKPQNKFWFAVVTLGWWLWEYLSNPRKRSPHYKTHCEWRLQLLKRRTKRLWQSGRIWRWLRRQRWFWLLLLAALSLLFACFLATGWPFDKAQNPLGLLRNNLSGGNTGAWNLFALLAGAAIAFAIWYFRDQNNLWQIENARKDINLKDFQKLAEWASGMHLVEDKVTHSDKATAPEQSAETTQSRESSQPPPNALLGTPSRRDGSASLQIAAVVQLQAFLNGEFGAQFQKPAFTLLSSIWLALVRPHCDDWQKINNDSAAYDAWHKEWEEISNTPLAQAITRTLLGNYNQALRQHRESLPGLLLAGVNSRLPSLDPLELDGFNLEGIQLQGADLRKAQLQGANLSQAQLQGAYLTRAQLQGTNLFFAELQGANLSQAQLQSAKLSEAQLRDANLSEAQLQSANLSWAQLQGANLSRAQLQDANLSGAQLQGANLRTAQLQRADLSGAQLQGANLRTAKLQGADLMDTQLKGAQLKGADLSMSKLQSANIINTLFDYRTKWDGAKTSDQTLVEIHTISDTLLPLLTHALRIKLRKQGLELPAKRYTEFEAAWDTATLAQQNAAYTQAGTQTEYKNDPI